MRPIPPRIIRRRQSMQREPLAHRFAGMRSRDPHGSAILRPPRDGGGLSGGRRTAFKEWASGSVLHNGQCEPSIRLDMTSTPPTGWQWASQRAAPPLILAGPIVRRVDPQTASVWVATSSATPVKLDVFAAGAPFGTG